MTSVYLVEDEIYALMALQQKILDLDEDYVIVGTADNGITALEQIPALRPDIFLTDIRMPDMDGLTLISRLQDAGCTSIPIIVSGYQDFEYAKTAIRLGAMDYLLKPVNPPELRSCLQNCVDKLARQRKSIISFLIGEERFSFENSLGQDSFLLLYIIISNPLSLMENALHPNVRYIPNAELEKLFLKFHGCRFIKCFDGFFSNEKLILINGDDRNYSLLGGNLPHFMKALEKETGRFVTVYHARANGNAFSSATRECRMNALRSVVLGESAIHSAPPKGQPVSSKLQETADLYAMMLVQNQPALLRSNITRLLTQWKNEGRTCVTVTEDLLFIMDTLKRSISSPKTADIDSRYFLENIMSFSADYLELAENFHLLLTGLFLSGETESKPPEELVESLIAYFKEHLSSNITLQDLEEKTGVSKVYICRIFKKFQNTTPIDYFTRLKIAKASELIAEFPGLSLREISDSLGFNDVYYFSKVFKKITGSSPSNMRPQG